MKYLQPMIVLFVLLVSACAHSQPLVDRGAVFTEQGFRAAEMLWHQEYWAKLKECGVEHAPGTQGAEDCFGHYFDADEQVDIAVRTAVALLRAYWTARAAGEKPDFQALAAQLSALVRDLPPVARQYFERIKGV